MTKVKATIIVTKIYELKPEHYPEGSTTEEMLTIDKEGIREDPEMFFSDCDFEDIKLEVIE